MSKRTSLTDIEAVLSSYHVKAPAESEWRHLKTDNVYSIVDYAVTSDDALTPTVLYTPLEEKDRIYPVIFVRPASDFFDGRFVQVPAFGRIKPLGG